MNVFEEIRQIGLDLVGVKQSLEVMRKWDAEVEKAYKYALMGLERVKEIREEMKKTL